jgi:peptidoglycan/xylan/chitin deacetylase (PgdA/CDA1 family)/uncharacterized caspase-like protein
MADVSALMDRVVRDFRATIVLAADEPEPGDPADTVAWMLHEREQESLAQLAEHLTDPAGLRAFLGRLESDPGLRDVDRLAFADVLAQVPDSPRVLDDRRALAGIATRYDAEVKKTLGRFGTRGMVDKREAWESYVAFVRGQLSRDEVMAEFRSDLDAINTGARGGGWRDDEDQITGRRFPEKSVLLTFDDGPSARLTPAVLEVLQRYGVRAVFFEVGRSVKRAKAISLKQEQAGHALGNHTFTHAFLPKLAEDKLDAQLGDTNQALFSAAKETPGLFRPPYGARNDLVVKAVSSMGMKTVLWNIDSRDWADPVPRSIANRVLAQVERNKRGIILFHDTHARTVEALPLVLDELVRQKYTFLAWNGQDFEATHGGSGEAALAAGAPLATAPLYRDSWAVVVGINQYKNWPRLSYAVADAKAVREILVRKYGFAADHIVELYDQQATRENIVGALGDSLADGRKVARDDRVFVFYAGHGATRQLPSGKSQGYLIPVDADAKNFQSQAISMTSFQDISDAIPAKHVFFVMDSCYSGLALTRGGAAVPTGDRSQFLQEITRRPAREVMTAGGANEQVADNGPNGHSIFTWTLLQGLEGKADLDGDGAITATELAAYTSPAVSSLSRQTPVFGHMPGDQGGEFVFASRGEEEFLSEASKQLDAEAIKLNADLERVRKQLEEKRARNQELRGELVAATAALNLAECDAGSDASAAVSDDEGVPAPLPTAVATQARREMERGMSLYREKRYEEAAQAFEAALQLNSNHVLAANNLGFTYVKMGRLSDAVSWYEKTLVLDPRRAVAWANLGDAYASLGRTEQAKRAYQRFLELSPEHKLAAAVRYRLSTLP